MFGCHMRSMKRKEEEHVFEPNSKRHQFVPAHGDEVMLEDAVAYFQLVKEAYKDNHEVFNTFTELMHAFKRKSIDVPNLIAEVESLFKDNDYLLRGFAAFIPKQLKRPVDVGEAIDCVKKIKARSQLDGHFYEEFLKVLHMYNTGKQSSLEVYGEAALLLRNHPDLLEEFMRFYPANNGACSVRQIKEFLITPSRVEKKEREEDFADDDNRSEEVNDPESVSCMSTKHIRGYGKGEHTSKESLDGLEHTLLVEKAVDLQVQSCKGGKFVTQSTVPMPLTRRVLRKEVDFLTLLQGNLPKKEDYQKLSNHLFSYSDGLIARKDLDVLIADVLQGCPELIGGFNSFMSEFETTELKFLSSIQQGFLNKRRKIRHAEQQLSFKERNGKGDNDQSKSVRGIDEKQDKNQWAKNVLLERKTQQEKESTKHASSMRETNEKHNNNQWEKKADPERKTQQEKDSMKHASSVRETNGRKNNDQWAKKVELERKTQQEKESTKHTSRDVLKKKSSHVMNDSRCFDKPVSDLALSKPQLCTPSYCLSTDNRSLPKVGFRTCLNHAVLNDTWVSIPTGKEAKLKLKNPYEETLFKLEEDRFELDMLLATFDSTVGSLEESLEKVMNLDIGEGVDIGDCLTGCSVRCIEHVYGEHGLDVLDSLRENPAVSLPTVLNRLKQKQDETLKYKSDMNKIWAEATAKNFHKSLDHRSFYFKEEDQKNLSTKGLIAEIKEANAMKRKSNDFIISLASGNSTSVILDLRLEYPDADIHNDLYRILKHSVQELFPNVDESEKIMHVWKVFLESSCHGCKGKSQEIVASRKHTSLNGEIEPSRHDAVEAHALQRSETQLEVGRQCGGLTNDKIATHITKYMSMDGCRDEVDDLECPERKQSKGCEFLSSKDALEQNFNGKFMGTTENILLEYATEQCSGRHTEMADHRGGIGSSANEFNASEQACTCEISEKDQTESGERVLGLHTDDQGAEYEDKEQRMDDMVAKETVVTWRTNLVYEDRPLCPKSTPSHTCEGNAAVFYGNDNMYILLRLYQALHERIHTAKVNAAATERKLKEEGDDSSYELYAKFLHALYGFLDGTTDTTGFEDVCRCVSGNKAYLFLTMDRLIYKFVKQLRVVASDETAIKLLALYDYEQSHSSSGRMDAVYHANASMLLDDENIYRFEQRFEAGQLFVQLMEGPLDGRAALPTNAIPSTCAKNLSKFLLLEPPKRPQRDPLFLKRHTHSCLQEDARTGALKDVLIMNGLELNVSCTNYKITYALDTEDFLRRKKCNLRTSTHVKPSNHICKATFKFRRWLNHRIQTETCLGG